MKWVQPKRYNNYTFSHEEDGKSKIKKPLIWAVVLCLLFGIAEAESFDDFVLRFFIAVGGVVFAAALLWFISLERIKVEITDTSFYCYTGAAIFERPDLYISDIRSYEFQPLSLGDGEFYNCHFKLKPLNSQRLNRDYFNIAVPKKYKEELIKRINLPISAKQSMSTPSMGGDMGGYD